MRIPRPTKLYNKFANARCSETGKRIQKGEPMWYVRAAPHGKRCRSMESGPHPYEDRRQWAEEERDRENNERSKRFADIESADAGPDADAAHRFDSAPTDRPTMERDALGAQYSRRSYSSLGALIAHVASGDCVDPSNRTHSRQLLSGDSDWAGYTDVARLERCYRDPPREGLGEIARIRDTIAGKVEGPYGHVRRRLHRQDCGDELDPWRALGGEPDCWSRMGSRRVSRPIVRVAVNTVLSARSDRSVMFYRGAAAAAIADALNAEGFPTEVYAVCFSSLSAADNSFSSFVEVLLQRPDTPQDLAALAYGLADIGVTRAGYYSAFCQNAPGLLCGSLGSPRRMPPDEAARFDVVLDQEVTDERTAVAAVRRFVGSVMEGAGV
jgi:hypothetical protein